MTAQLLMPSSVWLTAGWTMIHFLWVGCAVGILAAVARALMRECSPQWRYSSAIAFLVLLVLLPVAISYAMFHSVRAAAPAGRPDLSPVGSVERHRRNIHRLPDGETESVGIGNTAAPTRSDDPPDRPPSTAPNNADEPNAPGIDSGIVDGVASRRGQQFSSLVLLLPWLWAVGTPATFLLLATGLIGAERLRAQSRRLDDAHPLFSSCQQLAQRLGIHQPVSVGICPRLSGPVLVGILRPLILLPPAALAGWAPDQIEMVLLHELAHIRRWDNLVNLLQRIVESLLFFHPVVWWVSSWIRLERECCCDRVVLARTNDPDRYARLLAQLALQSSNPSFSTTAAMTESEVVVRIREILKLDRPSMRVSRSMVTLIFAFLVIVPTIIYASGNRGASTTAASDKTKGDRKAAQGVAGTEKVSRVASGPLLQFDRSLIPDYELKVYGDLDNPKPPPELVAILGSSPLKHWVNVSDVAVSPAGDRVASVAFDGVLRLWDPTTRNQVLRLQRRQPRPGALQGLRCVAYSADGTMIAAGGFNCDAVIRDAVTGRERVTLDGSMQLSSLAFDPTGKLLATGGDDYVIRVWEVGSGQLLRELRGHERPKSRSSVEEAIAAVAFSPDGTYLASGSKDKMVRLWEVANGILVRTLNGHESDVRAVEFTAGGDVLVTCDRNTVRSWEVATGKEIRTVFTGRNVNDIALHPNGKEVVIVTYGEGLRIVDLETGIEQPAPEPGSYFGAGRVAIGHNGSLVATAGYCVRLWDAATGKERFRHAGNIATAQSLAFAPDGKRLVASDSTGQIAVWNLVERNAERTLFAGKRSFFQARFHPNGETVYGLSRGKVDVWDVSTGALVRTVEMPGSAGIDFMLSRSGNHLVVNQLVKLQNSMTIWNTQTWQRELVLGTYGTAFFSPDEETMIVVGTTEQSYSGESKCTITLRDLKTKKTIESFEDVAGLKLRLARMTPDGQTLVLAGWTYTDDPKGRSCVVLWDVKTKRPRLMILDEVGTVTEMAVSPDSRTLVAVHTHEGMARVWDLRDGSLRQTIHVSVPGYYRIRSVAFAPDSRHFAVGLGNGTVYVYRTRAAKVGVKRVTDPEAGKLAKPKPRTPARELWKPLTGKPAPELDNIAFWLRGSPVKLANLRGKYVVLYFWEIFSEQDMGAMMGLHELFHESGLEIIVILPNRGVDRGEVIEQRERYFRNMRADEWGGRSLPFRVAIDGGGTLPIGQTGYEAYGATHANYRIPSAERGRRLGPMCLLIGPDGKLLRELPSRPHYRTHRELAQLMGIEVPEPPWQSPIDRLYRLPRGAVIKRIGTPFPQARDDYLFYTFSNIRNATLLFIQQDDEKTRRRMTTRHPLPLESLLSFFDVRRDEFTGPEELLDLEIPGDWAIREGRSTADLMRGLEEILRDELQLPIRFREIDLGREVLVASGKYKLKPFPNAPSSERIVLCIEDTTPGELSNSGAGSIKDLFKHIADTIGRPVIDETEPSRDLTVAWDTYLWKHANDLRSDAAVGREKRASLLENLRKQTSLRFSRERRKHKTWQIARDPESTK